MRNALIALAIISALIATAGISAAKSAKTILDRHIGQIEEVSKTSSIKETTSPVLQQYEEPKREFRF